MTKYIITDTETMGKKIMLPGVFGDYEMSMLNPPKVVSVGKSKDNKGNDQNSNSGISKPIEDSQSKVKLYTDAQMLEMIALIENGGEEEKPITYQKGDTFEYHGHQYVYGDYYFYDSFLYNDPEHHYRYDFVYNYHHAGKLVKKNNEWAIALQEFPYDLLVCIISNPGILTPHLGQDLIEKSDVKVQFAFVGLDDSGDIYIRVDHIYYDIEEETDDKTPAPPGYFNDDKQPEDIDLSFEQNKELIKALVKKIRDLSSSYAEMSSNINKITDELKELQNRL